MSGAYAAPHRLLTMKDKELGRPEQFGDIDPFSAVQSRGPLRRRT
jgi:hypothetical protein